MTNTRLAEHSKDVSPPPYTSNEPSPWNFEQWNHYKNKYLTPNNEQQKDHTNASPSVNVTTTPQVVPKVSYEVISTTCDVLILQIPSSSKTPVPNIAASQARTVLRIPQFTPVPKLDSLAMESHAVVQHSPSVLNHPKTAPEKLMTEKDNLIAAKDETIAR